MLRGPMHKEEANRSQLPIPVAEPKRDRRGFGPSSEATGRAESGSVGIAATGQVMLPTGGHPVRRTTYTSREVPL